MLLGKLLYAQFAVLFRSSCTHSCLKLGAGDKALLVRARPRTSLLFRQASTASLLTVHTAFSVLSSTDCMGYTRGQ